MDVLASLFEGPRARGAFLLRSILTPPWSLRIQDESPLTVIAVCRGQAWLLPDDAAPILLRPGGVAIVRGPDHYTVADDPATEPTVVIHPGQVSTTMDGEHLCDIMDLGTRTWGNTPDGEVVLLTGSYQRPSEVSRLLLDALPTVIALPDDKWDCPFLGMLHDETIRNQPGQEVVLDRLLDLVLIAALRAWLARPDSTTPAWHLGQIDQQVGAAVRLLQDSPADPWTVASIAAAVGVSRAALARRFTELVGVPPMAYLTEWRLALAADLLCDPSATLTSVAREVGYGSPFALSAAFKRIRGVNPSAYRTAALSAG